MKPVLRIWDKGEHVKQLQKFLGINADGVFGPKTQKAVMRFQADNGLVADGIVGRQTWRALEGNPIETIERPDINVTKYHLQNDEYVASATPKKQVFLHHTASSGSSINVINAWERDHNENTGRPRRVATCYVISRGYTRLGQNIDDGEIFEAFHPKYWAWHLGGSDNRQLEEISIGIEICSWGALTQDRNGKFINWIGSEVDPSEVITFHDGFRGYKHFHKYTDAQLQSVYRLLKAIRTKYGIEYQNFFDERWFDYKPEIRDGRQGVFTHTNVREDKNDCFPQPELMHILNLL